MITNDKVVAIDYTLTDETGSELVSSKDGDPLSYLHGHGNIISGLESALDGRAVGDAFRVTIAPTDGYGERDESLVQAVPKEQFEEAGELEVEMEFQVQSDDGDEMIMTIVDLDDESVTLDGNHPLAGGTLNFDIMVMNGRDASQEELDHSHVHGPDGHHHD